MDKNKIFKKNIPIDVAEFLNRLFINGHLTEKALFVGASLFLGFTMGFGLGRGTAETREVLAVVTPELKELSKNDIDQIKAEEFDMKTNFVALEKPTRDIASAQTQFFFTIRVAATESKDDAEAEVSKYKPLCQDVDYAYSSVHKRYLVYCGRFDDLASAQELTKNLSIENKLIVRRYPSSL